jgi:hypothetical protein
MRRCIWWPTVPTHAIAGGIALIAVATLGLLEVPRFTFFKDYTSLQASAGEFLTMALVFSVANMCFLYMHARGDYLRTRNALRPILTSFAVLSILFPVAWAVSRHVLKDAPSPDLHALTAGIANWLRGMPPSAAAALEWSRALRVLFVGEAALTAVLLFSGLWKAPPQDTLDFVSTMGRTRPLIKTTFRSALDVPNHDIDRLKLLLKGLVDSGAKLSIRELQTNDLDFAREVSKAAALLYGRLENRPGGTLDGLRNSDDPDMLSAVNTLSGG